MFGGFVILWKLWELLKFPRYKMAEDKLDLTIRKRILEGADNLFKKYGVRSVTMDDVAREVSMSKKTLYQYFLNKDGLVTAVTHFQLELERTFFLEIERVSKDAIDEMHRIALCMRRCVEEMNPSLLFDLKKFHHKAWDKCKEFKIEFIRGTIERNLIKGVEEGYYRKELDIKVISRFRVEQVEMIFDQDIFSTSEFQLVKVQLSLFDHFIHGLLTESGRELYYTYLKTEEKQSLV